MMTPLDIQTKVFSKAALGYKKEEVDAFMEELLGNYEELYKSYNETKEKLKSISKTLESYKGMEETMKNTLIVAQQSAEQLTKAARTEAEAILGEANQKSPEIVSKATQKIADTNAQYELLKKEMRSFMLKTKAEFEVQIKNLEKAQGEIEEG